jgi:hypothetical protein
MGQGKGHKVDRPRSVAGSAGGLECLGRRILQRTEGIGSSALVFTASPVNTAAVGASGIYR